MKVKVEILIEYDMNGEPFEAVKRLLTRAVRRLYNALILSAEMKARVEDYKLTITEVKE